jgi:23S rRNA (uracil1939-C5)-methyltransferase
MLGNCKYFGECGGCDFLELSNEDYQQKKRELLAQYFDKKTNEIAIDFFWGELSQRRKIILQIDKNNSLGFFKKRSKEIVKINNCIQVEKEISNLIPFLQKVLNHFQRKRFLKIQITKFDNIIDIIFEINQDLDFNETQKLISFFKNEHLNISYKINGKIFPILLFERNQIFINNLKLDLENNIFIQATKFGLNRISQEICEYLEIKNFKKIADIYAGFGAYSFAISNLAKDISAFEGSEEMTSLIERNYKKNSTKILSKISAFKRDLFSDPLTKKELNKFEFAIINPPRNGAQPQIEEIAKSEMKSLIYVSCNPKTFFCDIKFLLDANFKIKKLVAIDQFFASKHLEILGIFER